jgi:hypothetical protein
MFTLQTSFKLLLLKGGRGKIHSRGDCEYQGGKFLGLLSQLHVHPRIRPLSYETKVKMYSMTLKESRIKKLIIS